MNFLPASGGWYNCLFWCLNVICDLNEAGHCKNCCVGGYWRRVCSIWSCILSLNRYSINIYYLYIYIFCTEDVQAVDCRSWWLVQAVVHVSARDTWHWLASAPWSPAGGAPGPLALWRRGHAHADRGMSPLHVKNVPWTWYISIAVLLTNIVFTILLYSSWLSSFGSWKF